MEIRQQCSSCGDFATMKYKKYLSKKYEHEFRGMCENPECQIHLVLTIKDTEKKILSQLIVPQKTKQTLGSTEKKHD